jgi:hypothetical protein
MPESYRDQEKRVEAAVAALKTQKKPNFKATAARFGVSRYRLSNRFKGIPSRSTRIPSNLKLTPPQEAALCRYLDLLDQMGAYPRPRMIVNCVNSILKASHADPNTEPETVSEKWFPRWISRHPEYKKKRAKAAELERKRAEDREAAEDWFRRLGSLIRRYGIVDEDIWNFDETGFRIGIGRDNWIVMREKKHSNKAYIPVNTNREYATIVEAVNAVGYTAEPLIILSAKSILKGWFDCIPDGYHLSATETGYLNDDLAYQWIQIYNKATKGFTKGKYRLLLCDGFGSHATYEFTKYCEDNDIILFFLPPHTSHFLQPLDVGVFHVYKHRHAQAVEDASYTGCGKFTKVEFLAAISKIRQNTFKRRTIQHAFRSCGFVPFNPDVVLEKLPRRRQVRYTTPSDDSSIITTSSTPKTAKRIESLANRLPNLVKEDDFDTTLQKFVKASITQAHLAETLARELEQQNFANKQRRERAAGSRSRVGTGGTVSSTNMKKIKRMEKKYDDKKELLKLRPKWAKVMKELVSDCLLRGIIVKRQRLNRKKAEDEAYLTRPSPVENY